ncbi:MAG: SDR family NAD(P)-dependent oxidoreductase, partial [Acidobacteriota bacterium]
MNLNAGSLFSLEGKTVLLTGASGFLGRTMAQALLSNGARLVALGRSARLARLAEEWTRKFGAHRVSARRVDMYDMGPFNAVLDEIVQKESRLDVVINNAHELGPQTGFNVPEGALETAIFDQWMRNLTGGIYWA